MKSCFFAATERGGRGFWTLPRKLSLVAAMAALLFFCKHAASSMAAEPSFSSLPQQPTFALTNPIILVSPATLDFGLVPKGKRLTREFLVENIGRGKLVGAASVPAPFKIISGGNYALKPKEIQVVAVAYSPRDGLTNSAILTFSGGGGAKVPVAGKRLVEQN